MKALIERVTWPCGHPKSQENTQKIGSAGVRCRACRKVIAREHARRKRGYYARYKASRDQIACEGCGSYMVLIGFDAWECAAGCPISQGEWPEYTQAAQSMMRNAAALRAQSTGENGHG